MENPVAGGPGESPLDRRPVCVYGPNRRMTLGLAVAAILAVGAAVALHDGAGKLLMSVAAIVLAVCAGLDVYFSPRLVVQASGLRVNSPSLRATLDWSDLAVVRIYDSTHLGLATATLELDLRSVAPVEADGPDVEAGGQLVVFSRRALGTDPREVFAVLTSFGAPTEPH